MMILVIGETGQMAQALANTLRAPGESLVCTGRATLDLTDFGSLHMAFEQHKPDVVINAAAYTAVDDAESKPELAHAINVKGAENLAKLCFKAGVPLIHLSTDCAFDGRLERAYLPDDPVSPLGVYGRTKVDGENAVRSILPAHIIVRVSWIFSHYAGNFVKTMLALASTRDEVRVVEDQFGCPTYAPALAEALVEIARQALMPAFRAYGTYHLAGPVETDRASMARDIFAASAKRGGPTAAVVGVPTTGYPTPAERPLNARLNSSQAQSQFKISLPEWHEGLAKTLDHLLDGVNTHEVPYLKQ